MKIELKIRLEDQIRQAVINDENLDEVDWGSQYGVLISVNNAKEILEEIENLNKLISKQSDAETRIENFCRVIENVRDEHAYFQGDNWWVLKREMNKLKEQTK